MNPENLSAMSHFGTFPPVFSSFTSAQPAHATLATTEPMQAFHLAAQRRALSIKQRIDSSTACKILWHSSPIEFRGETVASLTLPSKTDASSTLPPASPFVVGNRTALEIHRAAPYIKRLSFAEGSCLQRPSSSKRNNWSESLASIMETIPLSSVTLPLHVYTSRTSRSRQNDAIAFHSISSPLPSRSIHRLRPSAFIASPELALVQIAAGTSSQLDLLELLWEACGIYQTKLTGTESRYQVSPLTNRRRLERFISRAPSLRGAKKISHALRYTADGSASSRETKLALLLGLPPMYGGYGLGIPHMNFEIAASHTARKISGKSSFLADLCWPEAKLDVEYQSTEYHEAAVNRIDDSRRTNALSSMGWTVIGITSIEMNNLQILDGIANTIRRHLHKRVRTDIADKRTRQVKLMRQLHIAPGFRH